MPTLNTLFKKIYGEELAPRGFVKIKGRQPYFVRLIGDEILHIITFKPEFASNPQNKAFDILGGVATVYRGALTLEKSPYHNVNWLRENSSMYSKLHPYETDEERKYRISISRFEYEKDNEEAMAEALYNSLAVTKKIMLPELNKAIDLRSCIEYYSVFAPSYLNIYTDENFGRPWNNWQYYEGLLQLLVYSANEYEEISKKSCDEYLKVLHYQIKEGIIGRAEEKFEEDKKLAIKNTIEDIENFRFIKQNPEQYNRIIKELERRKEANLQLLREYGLNV